MSFTNTTVGTTYACNGATTNFAIPFVYTSSSQVKVYQILISTGVATLKALTTDYTFTPNDTAPTAIIMNSAPSALYQIRVERLTPKKQETDYDNNSGFLAEDHEEALDKIVQSIQELGLISDNSLQLSKYDYGKTTLLPKFVPGAVINVKADGTGLEMGATLEDISGIPDQLAEAAASAAAAASSATSSATSATNSATSATASAASASASAASATTSSTQATASAASAAAALTSETNAATSATAAASSATAASGSATTATTQASNAATSATNAAASATTASTQATNASTSATNAASSASAASTSASAAAASAASAAADAASVAPLTSLPSGQIFIGSGTNTVSKVTPTGDIDITNAGVTSIGSGKVTHAMLATQPAATVMGNSTGAPAAVADITLSTASAASSIPYRDASQNMFSSNFVPGYTTTATAAGTTTLTVASTYQQFFTGATTQTVVLPVTSTLTLGHKFLVANNSSGAVTVQSSGANSVQALAAGTHAYFTCILTSGTSAASWAVNYVVAPTSPVTTKGDIYTYSSADARLPVGSNGQYLAADSAATTGLAWYTSDNSSLMTKNLGISASVASNALTIALKQADGSTNPSTGDAAVKIAVRSSTITSGSYNIRSVTGALSLVISSGSTLGHRSGGTHYIYVYLIDNAGTLELAASHTLFNETGIVSTTAEGGAGAADSGALMYSTTARSNVAFRCIGRLTSNQTTAGTWATAISNISLGNYASFAEQDIVVARYSTAAAQNNPSGAFTIIDFGTREIDTKNNVTTGSSWKFTATEAGEYDVFMAIRYAAQTTGFNHSLHIYLNGADSRATVDATFANSASGQAMPTTGSASVTMAVGDYIDIRWGHSIGFGIALIADATINFVVISKRGK